MAVSSCWYLPILNVRGSLWGLCRANLVDLVWVVPVWKSEIPPLCKDSGGCDLLLPEVWFQHRILPACSKSQGQAWTTSKASSARYPVQLYFLHLTPFVPPCFLRVFPANSSVFSHPHIPCFIAELELSSQPDPPWKHLPCHTRNYYSHHLWGTQDVLCTVGEENYDDDYS